MTEPQVITHTQVFLQEQSWQHPITRAAGASRGATHPAEGGDLQRRPKAGAKDAGRKVGTGSVQEVGVVNLQQQMKGKASSSSEKQLYSEFADSGTKKTKGKVREAGTWS